MSFCEYDLRICMDLFFFFKQKTAYEMRISDWSSDVCSSDLVAIRRRPDHLDGRRTVEQQREGVSHHAIVVDDEDPDRLAHAGHGSDATSRCSLLVSVTSRLPPARLTRSARPTRP